MVLLFRYISQVMPEVAQSCVWQVILLVFSWTSLCVPRPLLNERDSLIAVENAGRTGGTLLLGELEEHVNKKLMLLKKKDVDEAMNTGVFPPSMHFFKAKPHIDQSAVFNILKQMPKGNGSVLLFLWV